MSVLLTVMFSSHLETALKAARRCERTTAWSCICSMPASPGPPRWPHCQQLPLPWEALPHAIPSSHSSCSESCFSAELHWFSRMPPGHLAPSPAAITSYLFNKIKTCLVRPIEGRGDKSDLHAAAREGQPGARLQATCAVSGGHGPSFLPTRWQVRPEHWASAGSSTASTSTRYILGPHLSPSPHGCWWQGAGSGWGRAPRGKAQLGPPC